MNANQTVKSVLEKERVSTISASRSMGKTDAYLGVMLSRKTDPKVSTLSQFAEALNYELVLRSKDDGFEFIIDE